jgi:signal transduction histidine kinase
MCHELRNGLWAFSLEGRNLQHFFRTMAEYVAAEADAFRDAAAESGLDDGRSLRLRRAFVRRLAAAGVDPTSDVSSSRALAQEAYGHIESFARYLHLTVEELDRHLLGRDAGWEPESLPVLEIWNQACQLLAMRLRSAGVNVVVRTPASPGTICFDRRELIHVFVNLIKNAVEAMQSAEPPRELQFEVHDGGGQVVCCVRNGGPPIAAELLPFIFEQGFSTKATAGRGTGLSLVKSVLQRGGASIVVDSNESEGTTFRLSFQADREA